MIAAEAFMSDPKQVYQAFAIEEAELAFASFKEEWGEAYPIPYGGGRRTGPIACPNLRRQATATREGL